MDMDIDIDCTISENISQTEQKKWNRSDISKKNNEKIK